MFKTNHDAASVCRIAILQKVLVGFLLLYLVAIACSFTLPDDLRPMVGYLMLPVAVLAAVFLFLLTFQVFGARVGAVLLAIDLAVVGICLWGSGALGPPFEAPPIRIEQNEQEALIKELKQHLANLKNDPLPPPDSDPDIGDLPTDAEREKHRKALAHREQIKAASAIEQPRAASGPGLIWALVVNLILLIVVNARAASILRRRGVSMGLLGPHLPDLVSKQSEPAAARDVVT